MADKDLKSFKISDTRRPMVDKPKKPSPEEERAALSEQHSLGFRRIETILENDEAAKVGEALNNLLVNLEEFERNSNANKDKAAAKKAIIAVERVADLLDFLFQTKTQLQSSP